MRLSKKKRIAQHKRVYGRTFKVTADFAGEEVTVEVKVTKLTQKGNNNDRMYVRVTGNIMYDQSPIDCFAHITWTEAGVKWYLKGGYVNSYSWGMVDQIIKGCETILMEVTILEDLSEQASKT